MGNDNYSLGSKPNPIPWSSFIHDVNFNNWVHPAWVGTDESNKFLADSDGQEVNCTGSYNSPYAYTMYQQLSAADCWSGGWVNNNSVISYISSSGTNYPPIYDNVFGDEDYPIPESIYEEMCDNEIWNGGWVEYGNGNVDYIQGPTPNNGGSGSGSGSGSDEGSGSGNGNEGSGSGSGNETGLIAGNAILYPNNLPINWEILVEWGDGDFNNTQAPSISAALRVNGNSTVVGLNAHWINNYVAKITGRINFTGDLTGFYGGNVTVDIPYTIPAHYHSLS